jgi:hypothetical protein
MQPYSRLLIFKVVICLLQLIAIDNFDLLCVSSISLGDQTKSQIRLRRLRVVIIPSQLISYTILLVHVAHPALRDEVFVRPIALLGRGIVVIAKEAEGPIQACANGLRVEVVFDAFTADH